MKKWTREEYVTSTDKSLLQLDRVHEFLSTKAYWSLGIPFSIVEKAASNSLTFCLLQSGLQIGYARIVTDYTTHAWLCDLYIEEEHRRKGLSKWLVECILEELKCLRLRRICLATKDAHGLYRQFGFEVTATPENWMEIKNDQIYSHDKNTAN
jgi:GNAT superfamily N-acetyltransferase